MGKRKTNYGKRKRRAPERVGIYLLLGDKVDPVPKPHWDMILPRSADSMHKTLLGIWILLFSWNSFADQPKFTESQISTYKNELASEDRLYNVGFYMATGGLTGLVISRVVPYVGGVGFTSYIIGLPVMGNSADDVEDLALKVNPGYVAPASGWGYYGSSWGLMTVGAVWTLMDALRNFGSGYKSSDIFLPLGIFFSGVTCQGISWYKFSARHRAAHRAVVEGLNLSLTTHFQGDAIGKTGLSFVRQF